MFEIGDKILYPMHGAGTIEAIEEKEILGENKLYYILNIPGMRMKIMIPTTNVANLGVRQIVNPTTLENVLENINLGDTDPVIYENQRYCRDLNKKKIVSGDIYKGTEIIRDLTRKSHKHKLGAEDTNMLNNARQIFLSELMQVKGVAHEQAVVLLDEILESQLESI
ncbi:MAG: CarD family transcriptional regulator [Eubacteriales bacterium]